MSSIPYCKGEINWLRGRIPSADIALPGLSGSGSSLVALYTESGAMLVLNDVATSSSLTLRGFLLICKYGDPDHYFLGYPSLVNGVPSLAQQPLPSEIEFNRMKLISAIDSDQSIYFVDWLPGDTDSLIKFRLYEYDTSCNSLTELSDLVGVRPVAVFGDEVYCHRQEGFDVDIASILQIRDKHNVDAINCEVDLSATAGAITGILPINADSVLVFGSRSVCHYARRSNDIVVLCNVEDEYLKLVNESEGGSTISDQ